MAAYRPFMRFVVIGGVGFVIDAGLTHSLILCGLSAWWARIPAIGAAMAFTWQGNRRWTYGIAQKPGWREAGRYLGVAGAMACLNYTVYSFLTLAGVPPIVGIVVATALQSGIGFFGYRRFAFQESGL